MESFPVYHAPNKNYYINVPCSFDIETTSFFQDAQGNTIDTHTWAALDHKSKEIWHKRCCMYIWQFGLCGKVIFGRTWQEFKDLIYLLSCTLGLSEEKRLICFVHNLSYEFQFIKKWFKWPKLFATAPYEPLYAVCDEGIEFRCSYRNSNRSLEKLGNDLLKYKVQKAVGNLDYDKLRHSETPLTNAEILYCINDVKVVMAYIMEQIEREGKVHRIPLTSTGYVRRYLKECCFKNKANPKKSKTKRFHYVEQMKAMSLTPEVYVMCKKAMQGGFTHCNALWMGEELKGVASKDITSDYPAIMISEKFPITAPKLRKINDLATLNHYIKMYCCLFEVRIWNLHPKYEAEQYLSRSHCDAAENVRNNNGRIYSADYIETTITEQDFLLIQSFYTFRKIQIGRFYTFEKGYLPKDIVSGVLKLYADKTIFKGVEGKEVDYMLSKNLLNSCFGCCVTDIYNPAVRLNEVSGLWELDPDGMELEEAIDQYNKKRSRFLYYPWGVWVTAYGRRNICAAILECLKDHSNDYVYTDTDSIKMLNPDKHKTFFDKYNDFMLERINKALHFHKIGEQIAAPADQKGKLHPLGVFDDEGIYDKFKTLGAKRYLYRQGGHDVMTVAGLSKKKGLEYLKQNNKDIFKAFDDDMYVPAMETGKLTHTYIDTSVSGGFTDYTGRYGQFDEKSAVHLAPCDFTLKITSVYTKFVNELKIMGDLRYIK